ncbi:MAG: phosphate ABC transporter substrate-binding protein PstS [Pseudomonadota bacterium]
MVYVRSCLPHRAWVLAFFLLICSGCEVEQTRISAAGATFPAELFRTWARAYQEIDPGMILEYESVGSGRGVELFLDQAVDFAVANAPITPEERSRSDEGVHVIPSAAGVLVLGFDVPGVDSLKLSHEAIAGIYLGTITRWDDPRILQENQGVELPDLPIVPVFRSGPSGSTVAMTAYLSAISPTWREQYGISGLVQWPAGVGALGSRGMLETIRNTVGSIGYVDFGRVDESEGRINVAELQNESGAYVRPDIDSIRDAIEDADYSPTSMVTFDAKSPGAYPIVVISYVLAREEYQDERIGQAVKGFLGYAMTDGQQDGLAIGFPGLPEPVRSQAEAAVDSIDY